MAQKTVDVDEVVLGKQAEQMGLEPDAALQALVDQAGSKIKRELLNSAFRSQSEADQITALTAIGANPLT